MVSQGSIEQSVLLISPTFFDLRGKKENSFFPSIISISSHSSCSAHRQHPMIIQFPGGNSLSLTQKKAMLTIGRLQLVSIPKTGDETPAGSHSTGYFLSARGSNARDSLQACQIGI